MRSRTSDIPAGLATLAVAGIFQAQCVDLEGASLLFPRMLIIFMTIGGVYIFASGLLPPRIRVEDAPCEIPDEEPVAVKRVANIALASILYVGIIPLFGFYPASVLFLFCMAMILSDTRVTTTREALGVGDFYRGAMRCRLGGIRTVAGCSDTAKHVLLALRALFFATPLPGTNSKRAWQGRIWSKNKTLDRHLPSNPLNIRICALFQI